MKREVQDLIRMLLVGLALLASVEPLLCPLLGALHLDHDHAQGDGLEPVAHCHGDTPALDEHSESDHDGDCEHCHEHQSKLAVRLRTDDWAPAAPPAPTFACPTAVPAPTLEILVRAERRLGPRGRPDGLPPLPLRI